MNNAVIYARFSSTGQNEQTIDGQIRVCKEYAEKQGLSIIGVYDGDKAKSASKDTEKRKDLHKMFAAAETGAFQFIIVYKMDRFARNRNESRIFKSELAKHGVRVLSATENITDDEGGELYEMILEWNDEKYSQRLSKRVRDGLTTSIENGTYTGQRLICGYKLVDTERAGRRSKFIHTVAIDEEQAEVVRFVFEEYAKGTDKKIIAEMLNEKGLRYNGKPYHFRMFEKWLPNRKYTGEFLFGGRLCNNMFPQIIDNALFEKVQERLKANKILAGANSAVEPYLLTGKAFCGHCGTAIIAGGGTSKTGTKHYYYVCKKKNKGLCDKKRSDKNNLEKAVTEFVIRCLENKEIVSKAADDVLNYYEQRTGDDGMKSIDTRIAHAQNEVEQMTNAYIMAKNDLLRANIEKKMNELEVYLQDLNKQKAQIRLERGLRITKPQILEFVAELIKGDPNDKTFQRRIIDKLVYKVYISDGSFFVLVTFFEMNKTEHIDFDDTKNAIQGVLGCSNSNTIGAADRT